MRPVVRYRGSPHNAPMRRSRARSPLRCPYSGNK
jgi:hypothetical protein